MGLRVAQGEQNQKADRDREESEGEGVEPPEGCQDATDGRVARRANREDARVVAQRGRALLTVKMALMTVTLRVPRVTAPIPCSCRCAWCGPKPDAKARRPPMIPMRSRAGTRILRRLWRSGRTPSTGISATSGKVKMVIKSTPAHSLRRRRPLSRAAPGDARDAEERHEGHPEGHPEEEVQVVVLVDLPSPGLVPRPRGHEEGRYQRAWSVAANSRTAGDLILRSIPASRVGRAGRRSSRRWRPRSHALADPGRRRWAPCSPGRRVSRGPCGRSRGPSSRRRRR
jgi:hypothetical protein